jgi:hypothetical protein
MQQQQRRMLELTPILDKELDILYNLNLGAQVHWDLVGNYELRVPLTHTHITTFRQLTKREPTTTIDSVTSHNTRITFRWQPPAARPIRSYQFD